MESLSLLSDFPTLTVALSLEPIFVPTEDLNL